MITLLCDWHEKVLSSNLISFFSNWIKKELESLAPIPVDRSVTLNNTKIIADDDDGSIS